MGELFLGLDVGTQGTKGLLVDVGAGCVLARAARSYGLIEDLEAGAAEQHPDTWIAAVEEVCAELLGTLGARAEQVRALGVSGQQHGLVLVDEDGRVLRPAKLWCDTSTAGEAEELSSRLGCNVPCGFTASKVLWVRRHEPDVWERARWVLLPHDFVNLRLTGRACMEFGDASGTGWFDPVTRQWDAPALEALGPGMEQRLPPLLEPGAPAGSLDPGGARLTGLAEGTLVAAGSGDNMCSALGSGATRPGVVVVSLGTSGTIFSHSPRPVLDPEGAIAAFCGATGDWLPLLCTMNVTGVSEEVRTLLGAGSDAALADLTRAAGAVPPGSDGLLLLPYLQGERVPDLPRATGALLGVRTGSLTPGALYRAALEGPALVLGWGLERLLSLGIHAEELHLVGGGARNALWCRILCDVSGLPVRRLAEPDAAALGAAIQACWTWRLQAGDAIAVDELAAPWSAGEGDVLEPDDAAGRVHAAQLARLKQETERLFGAG